MDLPLATNQLRPLLVKEQEQRPKGAAFDPELLFAGINAEKRLAQIGAQYDQEVQWTPEMGWLRGHSGLELDDIQIGDYYRHRDLKILCISKKEGDTISAVKFNTSYTLSAIRNEPQCLGDVSTMSVVNVNIADITHRLTWANHAEMRDITKEDREAAKQDIARLHCKAAFKPRVKKDGDYHLGSKQPRTKSGQTTKSGRKTISTGDGKDDEEDDEEDDEKDDEEREASRQEGSGASAVECYSTASSGRKRKLTGPAAMWSNSK